MVGRGFCLLRNPAVSLHLMQGTAAPTPNDAALFVTLQNASVGAAIDQQALPGDVAGLGRTEKGAGGTEFGSVAVAPRGDGALALLPHGLDRDTAPFCCCPLVRAAPMGF